MSKVKGQRITFISACGQQPNSSISKYRKGSGLQSFSDLESGQLNWPCRNHALTLVPIRVPISFPFLGSSLLSSVHMCGYYHG
jgi:hypothetical protein